MRQPKWSESIWPNGQNTVAAKPPSKVIPDIARRASGPPIRASAAKAASYSVSRMPRPRTIQDTK
ncbi:hypothetical protein ABIF16_003935 [Bradyrhizobium elkanii]